MWIAATLGAGRQPANTITELTITAAGTAFPAARRPRGTECLLVCPAAARSAERCPGKGQRSAPACPAGRQARMKHATTREVFAYWDNCRGDRPAPGAIGHRSGRDPQRAVRHVHSHLRPQGRASVPSGGHAALRLDGLRIEGRAVRRSVGRTQPQARSRACSKTIADETVGLVASVSGETEDGQSSISNCCCFLSAIAGACRRACSARCLRCVRLIGPASSRCSTLELGHYRHLGPAVDAAAAPHFARPRAVEQAATARPCGAARRPHRLAAKAAGRRANGLLTMHL